MRHDEENRTRERVRLLASAIAQEAQADRRYVFMEFCGGHTHAIFHSGLQDLLPPNIELVHGPGCPVCVLPTGRIDTGIELARRANVTLCTYGDVLRVPGSRGVSLSQARAEGADVRMVYSITDALRLAGQRPEREVVFFAIGFETTTPPTAVATKQAQARGVKNFTVLCNHVLTPAAITHVLESPELREMGAVRLDGFIGPGHVSVIIGTRPFEFFAEEFAKPVVITGFEPLDVLQAILMLVRQTNDGRAEVENQYTGAVTRDGNCKAQAIVAEVFELRRWFEWDGDFVVLLLVMAFHELLDRVGHGNNPVTISDADSDFVQLDALRLKTAGTVLGESLAVTGFCGLQRYEHLVGSGLDRAGTPFCLSGLSALFHDSDHTVVVAAHTHIASQRQFERKQNAGHFSTEHSDTCAGVHLRLGKKTSERNAVITHFRVPRHSAVDLAIHATADVPDVVTNDATGNDDADAGNGGLNPFQVGVRQAILDDETGKPLLRDFLVFRRLDAAEDDVLAAKFANLFLRLIAGSFANGEHGNHGTDAEHNAEHRQQRPQPVHPEAFQAEPHGALQAGNAQPTQETDGCASGGHRFRSGHRAAGWCANNAWQCRGRG